MRSYCRKSNSSKLSDIYTTATLAAVTLNCELTSPEKMLEAMPWVSKDFFELVGALAMVRQEFLARVAPPSGLPRCRARPSADELRVSCPEPLPLETFLKAKLDVVFDAWLNHDMPELKFQMESLDTLIAKIPDTESASGSSKSDRGRSSQLTSLFLKDKAPGQSTSAKKGKKSSYKNTAGPKRGAGCAVPVRPRFNLSALRRVLSYLGVPDNELRYPLLALCMRSSTICLAKCRALSKALPAQKGVDEAFLSSCLGAPRNNICLVADGMIFHPHYGLYGGQALLDLYDEFLANPEFPARCTAACHNSGLPPSLAMYRSHRIVAPAMNFAFDLQGTSNTRKGFVLFWLFQFCERVRYHMTNAFQKCITTDLFQPVVQKLREAAMEEGNFLNVRHSKLRQDLSVKQLVTIRYEIKGESLEKASHTEMGAWDPEDGDPDGERAELLRNMLATQNVLPKIQAAEERHLALAVGKLESALKYVTEAKTALSKISAKDDAAKAINHLKDCLKNAIANQSSAFAVSENIKLARAAALIAIRAVREQQLAEVKEAVEAVDGQVDFINEMLARMPPLGEDSEFDAPPASEFEAPPPYEDSERPSTSVEEAVEAVEEAPASYDIPDDATTIVSAAAYTENNTLQPPSENPTTPSADENVEGEKNYRSVFMILEDGPVRQCFSDFVNRYLDVVEKELESIMPNFLVEGKFDGSVRENLQKSLMEMMSFCYTRAGLAPFETLQLAVNELKTNLPDLLRASDEITSSALAKVGLGFSPDFRHEILRFNNDIDSSTWLKNLNKVVTDDLLEK